MTKVIHKFNLSQSVWMPKGAEILTIQLQYDSPKIWAIVDPYEINQESRIFRVIGTGEEFDHSHNMKYISTCQTDTGLVWHVFEILL